MSISQDPDVFKILIYIIAGLVGILELVAFKFLISLKETDKVILNKQESVEKRLTVLETEHRVRHGKYDG